MGLRRANSVEIVAFLSHNPNGLIRAFDRELRAAGTKAIQLFQNGEAP